MEPKRYKRKICCVSFDESTEEDFISSQQNNQPNQGEPRMLQQINLFHTPNDWDELMKWINLHDKEDIAHLAIASAMAWNLAAKITKENQQ